MHSLELLHPDLEALIDALLQRQRWSWEQVANGGARIGDQVVDFGDLQWFLVNSDPVLWGECNLVNRPEDGGGLWRFFEYQKASARFRGHVVHQDGAEVGKSREIVLLLLFGCIAEERGSSLVGSALDGDLDELWEEIFHQVSSNPFLKSQVQGHTTKPYRRITFKNGLKGIFRPAGHDGRAYRGVHVRGFCFHDEAAKVVRADAWSEFWRAAKPGCLFRIYSVPTGDRICTFQRIADTATPSDQIVPQETSPGELIEQILRGKARRKLPQDAVELSRELGGRTWVRFHWPKTLMPAPFWSEERRQAYLDMFGGSDTPGYVHNVLGLPGDPEYSVFPTRLLDPATCYIESYRSIQLAWDSRAGRLDVTVRRLNPNYEDDPDPGEIPDGESEGSSLQPMLTILRDSLDVESWKAWPAEEKALFIAALTLRLTWPLGSGELVGGVDVASTTVTEINIEQTLNGRDYWVGRISLIGWDWFAQKLLLEALDRQLHLSGGWGVDATGAGKPLVDIIQAGELGARVSGFVFNYRTPATNPETGAPLLDPQTGQAVYLTYKEQGTQLLELALAANRKAIPRDPELIFLLLNHTYSEAGGHRTYSKVNDHVADSWRCCALRRLMASGVAWSKPPGIFIPSGGHADAEKVFKDY